MTEQVGTPEFERRDPELEAISDQLGALSEECGFVETPTVAAARATFLRGVPAGRYDSNNPGHKALFSAFRDAADATMDPANPNEFEQIGYQIALARLWLDADDPTRFYDVIDLHEDTGVVEMMYRTPGCEHLIDKLYEIVDELELLNGS